VELKELLDLTHLRVFFVELARPKQLRSLTLDNVDDVDMKQYFGRLEVFDDLRLTHCNLDVPLF
jgi:hypothetical protein